MKLTRTVLLALPFLAACGGSIVLKSPIQDRCNQAGLQACDDIVGGTLVYIDGDKVNGKDQILRGAGQNSPDKVKAYAATIRALPLDKIPNGQKYATIIFEICDILAGVGPAPVAAPPPGPPQPVAVTGLQLEGAQLAGIPNIEFDTAQATIKATPANAATLGLLVVGSQQNKNINVLRVEGHTDSDGDPASNQALSERRAQAVVDWLVAHGVDRARLHPTGCAARDPLVPNDTPEHKALNRRTEFDIEQINGGRPDGYTEPCAPNSFRKR
jgi:OOP family OmpA-OmpF porin